MPGFELTDQEGLPFASSQLDGKVWVATFFFSRCGATCPLQTEQFAALQERLRDDATLDDVRLVSLTVDPSHDTPAVLREYAGRAGADPSRWTFLTGDRGTIRGLCRDGFRLPVLDTDDPQSLIAHSQSFILVDRHMRIRGYHDGLDAAQRGELWRGLRAVVDEDDEDDESAGEPAREERELPALSSSLAFSMTDEGGRPFGSNELFGEVWLGACLDASSAPEAEMPADHFAALEEVLEGELRDRDDGVELWLLGLVAEADRRPARAGAASGAAGSIRRKALSGPRAEVRWLCDDSLRRPERRGAPEVAAAPGARVALVDRSLRLRGSYDILGAEDVRRLLHDLRIVLDERPPVAASPETLSPPWLASRRDEQVAAAALHDVFHDFRFEDRREESGIRFRNVVTPDGHRAYKLCHYDHGNGIAIADVDGDGLLDVYFGNQVGGNELWRNLGGGSFADITESAGVAVEERISVTASFADIDNDGDADLHVTTVRGGNVLLENDGTGRFEDISAASGLDHVGHSSAAIFFDYDRDGLLDLFLTNVGRYTSDEVAPAPTDYKGGRAGRSTRTTSGTRTRSQGT